LNPNDGWRMIPIRARGRKIALKIFIILD